MNELKEKSNTYVSESSDDFAKQDNYHYPKLPPMADNTGGEPPTNPANLPSIGTKPGWTTSQGQLSAVFVVVSMIFAAFGYKNLSPDKIENVYELLAAFAPIIIPLLGSIPVINNYIVSRGKEKSNAIWATAAVNTANAGGNTGPNIAATLVGGKLGTLGKIAGGLLGGRDWKDPERYLEIGKTVSEIVPGGAKINKVLESIGTGQKVPVEELSEAVELIIQNQVETEKRSHQRFEIVREMLAHIQEAEDK